MFSKKLTYILLIFSLFVFSCKTTKKVSKKQISAKSQIYDSIINNYLSYNTLYFKSTLKFKNQKKSYKLKASIKIKKDSLIIVSLSPGLGIEAARIKFTNDSIFILDRMSSQFTKASYKYLLDSFDIHVNYADIQAILSSQLVIYPKDRAQDLKNQFIYNYKLEHKQDIINFYRKTTSNIENLISVSASDYRIVGFKINELAENRFLNVKYNDLFSDDLHPIAKSISIISFASGKYTNIDLNNTKVYLNKKLSFSFKVSSKYKVIQF